jgi:hypothetical protein
MTTFLTPSPKQQFFNAAGVPLVGGKVYTYAAGTSTPLATYQDSTGTVSNTNPIILDSRGECNLWLLPANAYKFILRDSADALIWTVDNINLGINFSNVIITGGTLNGVTIGNIAPGTAVFTNLSATGTITFNGVTQMQIPAGPSANRSTTPVDGMIRYNSTTDLYEGNSTVAGQTISTLQLTGTVTAILTTANPHGLSTGDYITVSGATPAAYNGSYNITYISSTSFSYTMASNPGGNASVVGSYVAHSWSSFSGNVTNVVTINNRIINGAMVIDQRNAGASVTVDTTNFTYTVDRWGAIESTDGVMTAQQVTTAPTGFNNSLKLTTTTADATLGATQFAYVGQRIEGYNVADLGWGTANAKTVTVSFWVRSSLTGTFGGSIYNDASNRSYPFSYTISVADTWEQKSVTIAGDTSGTWLTTNGTGLILVFGLGVGSTYSATAGAWAGSLAFSATGATSVVGTNGATFYITGVQLEVGSQATGFEYRQYGTELALCQRYCYAQDNRAGNSFFYFGVSAPVSSSAANCLVTYPVTMRIKPSVTLSAGNTFFVDPTTSDFTGSIIDQASPIGGVFSLTGGSGLTAGYSGRCLSDNTDAAFAIWTAEL